jgi:hypothetical protein
MEEFAYRQLSFYCDVKTNDLYILPNGFLEPLGPIVEIEYMEHLVYPYDSQELIDKVQKALTMCYSKVPPIPAKATAIANLLGKKSYAEATRNKKLVMLRYREYDDVGYRLYPTKKVKRYGYQHLTDLAEDLGETLEKEELFLKLKKVLEISTV